MLRIAKWGAGLWVAASLIACGEDEEPAGSCSGQLQVACTCSDGRSSVALCTPQGPGFCQCGAPLTGSDAGEPGSADGDLGGDGVAGDGFTGDGAAADGSDADGAGDGQADGSSGEDGNADGSSGGASCLQGAGDFSQDGPYEVTTKDVTIGSLGGYTIFYPSSMEANCPHPIVAWGNGTGVTGSGVYAHFQRRAASWGMVVIAAHTDQAGSNEFLAGGIDYMLEQNADASSAFAGKLSDRAGVAGHSQGGFAASTASQHPNVQAEVNVQGGGTPRAGVALLCETGVQDFVRAPCTASYSSASGPAFLADHSDADHINTPTLLGASSEAGQQYVRLYAAWFRCFLADDSQACALFEGGANAPVCGDSSWATCESRNF